jgi:hypothetical protein
MKSRMVPAESGKKSGRKSGNNVLHKPISNTTVLYHYYLNKTNRPVPDTIIEKSHENCIDVSHADLNEFLAFHTFISSHIQPSNMCDTPCMLLWAEWVRFCLKEMHTFPSLILEKEFGDLVVNHFGFSVADDEARGRVYPGVRFVWKKNVPLNSADSHPAMV